VVTAMTVVGELDGGGVVAVSTSCALRGDEFRNSAYALLPRATGRTALLVSGRSEAGVGKQSSVPTGWVPTAVLDREKSYETAVLKYCNMRVHDRIIIFSKAEIPKYHHGIMEERSTNYVITELM
jgi:hypothetical protein